jgi:hypothetical protein
LNPGVDYEFDAVECTLDWLLRFHNRKSRERELQVLVPQAQFLTENLNEREPNVSRVFGAPELTARAGICV